MGLVMGLIGPSRRAIIDKRGGRRRAASIRRSHTGHNKEQVGGSSMRQEMTPEGLRPPSAMARSATNDAW
jgi:hypothetical protein